jgi:hypothetical protein
MRKTFVMRGKTSDFKVTGATEVLNFSGYKPGYAYRLVEFKLYPSTAIGATSYELSGTITAARTAADPENPDFNDEGLIATSIITMASTGSVKDNADINIVNDTFLITQNLILAVIDTFDGSNIPINWQCRFESVKMSGPEEASVNYKQFAISDE